MIDFPFVACSKGMYVYCFAFYLFIFLVYWKRYSNQNTKKLDFSFFFLICVYVVTSFYNGDFWHLQAYISFGYELWKPSEEVYDTIAALVNNNYLLFRTIVWGGGLVLLTKVFKRYGLNQNTSLYYFFVLYISVFDYARASLAMVIYFLGFSFFTKPAKKHSIAYKVFGILLMLLSYNFHTSMLAIIVLTVIIWVPWNKTSIVILLITFPVISYLVNWVVFDYILAGGVNDLIENKISTLSEIEAKDTSLLETIRLVWHYSTFYIPFLVVTYLLYFKYNIEEFPNYLVQLYKLTLAIVILATSTLFLGFSNRVLFYRFLYMTIIPLTVLICSLKELGVLSSKAYKKLIVLGAMYIMFRHSKVLLRWSGPLT